MADIQQNVKQMQIETQYEKYYLIFFVLKEYL